MKKTGYKRFWHAGALLLADMALFGTTTVARVPSFVVIIGFLLLVLTIYAVAYALLRLAALYGLNFPRPRQLAIYISILASGLLALQSIGELDRHDVLVWLPLMLIGYLYSAYVRTSRRNLEG